ncbi:MAG TPA: GAF domain-containing sensor histidine kinase [Gemmatimonadales bacterium]|nr:GAF domain-containing sensor histidine kinase [Gemmatimonadales bacterium]
MPSLISELSLEGVLQRVADLAAEVIGARYAAVGMLGADGRSLDTFTTHGVTREQRARIGALPQGLGVLGLVMRQGRTVRVEDITTHPARAGFPPNHPPMRSFLGVPIIGKRGVFGDLYLTEKLGAPAFSEEDEHLATLLASKAAAAIENARLHEESARLLEEVQRLHRARERFFAMVNHELRNSLAAVYGWAEMLVRRKDPQTVPRAAFEVLDSAEQSIALINDLLDLSRLDEDRLRPVIQEVECCGVIRQAVSRVTPAADSKGVTVESGLPDYFPACRTDPHRVEQILVNLLTNAVRHTPSGSTVRVSLREAEGRISFQIEDEGPGVAVEDTERIFDVYQTHAVEEGQGSGLGLPLSRRLARLLGGELSVVPRPGEGGCFVLELPSARP